VSAIGKFGLQPNYSLIAINGVLISVQKMQSTAAFVWLVNLPLFSDSSATSALAEAVPGEARCMPCIFWA